MAIERARNLSPHGAHNFFAQDEQSLKYSELEKVADDLG
jgi:hypothetical protein